MPLQLVVAIPTFVCSCLSLIASLTFAAFYAIFPPERHFRQALIINLLVADLINSANNTVSGAIALARHRYAQPLEAGVPCTANGYIGQFSVQGIDFNVLIISIAVLLTVRQSRIVIEPPWWQVILICAIPWIPPLVTSNLALGLSLYGPVSGNWCWIEPKYFAWRYALTHSWRIAVFLTTIGVYTYVYIYLKRVYGKLHISTSGQTEQLTEMHEMAKPPGQRHLRVTSTVSVSHDLADDRRPLATEYDTKWSEAYDSSGTPPSTGHLQVPGTQAVGTTAEVRAVVMSEPAAAGARQRKTAVRKMLLLNGYPILYIILWTPGMANRIWEAFGESPTWLRVAQASTQLVGLANAMTYAYNEQLRGRMRGKTTGRLFS